MRWLILAARLALLANRAPGMICLAVSFSFTPATSAALRLKGAAHFVAIDGARKSQSDGAASLHLHAKRYVASIDAAGQRRGAPWALKGAAELGTVLLDVNCGLL
jgi:hypothetical protein